MNVKFSIRATTLWLVPSSEGAEALEFSLETTDLDFYSKWLSCSV